MHGLLCLTCTLGARSISSWTNGCSCSIPRWCSLTWYWPHASSLKARTRLLPSEVSFGSVRSV